MRTIRTFASQLLAIIRGMFDNRTQFRRVAERGTHYDTGHRELVVVTFYGGPLDGWSDFVEVEANDGSLNQISLPVSESMIRLMQGESISHQTPVTSVAHYELERGSLHWSYRFVRSDNCQGRSPVTNYFQ